MKKYYIYTKKLNEDNYAYLQDVLEDDSLDEDNLFSFLLQLPESEFVLILNEEANHSSESIISIIYEASENNDNLSIKETRENIIVLDISKLNESKHDYLKEIFNLPDYYGNNLDALYDCMSELDDTKIVILNMKDLNDFSLEVINVFNDVHDEYDNLNIIYQDEEEKEEDSLD